LRAHADIDTYKLLVSSSHRSASGQLPAASGPTLLYASFLLLVARCRMLPSLSSQLKDVWWGAAPSPPPHSLGRSPRVTVTAATGWVSPSHTFLLALLRHDTAKRSSLTFLLQLDHNSPGFEEAARNGVDQLWGKKSCMIRVGRETRLAPGHRLPCGSPIRMLKLCLASLAGNYTGNGLAPPGVISPLSLASTHRFCLSQPASSCHVYRESHQEG